MSTSLVPFNAADMQRELIATRRERDEAEAKVAELEADLVRERAKSKTVERGVQKLRQQLSPLHQALGMVFGEIEAMGIEERSPESFGKSEVIDPRKVRAWDDWKQKMGASSAAAKIIDFLMIHGELTQTQMRIHLGTNRMQTVYDACSKLNKAQILNKNGDKFSLKEL